jgi:hypothetical protein
VDGMTIFHKENRMRHGRVPELATPRFRSLVLNICERFRILTVFVLALLRSASAAKSVLQAFVAARIDLKKPHSQGANNLRAPATNLGESSQLPPGTFLNKSSPGFGPIFGRFARNGPVFGIGGFEPPQPISSSPGFEPAGASRVAPNSESRYWDRVRCYPPQVP